MKQQPGGWYDDPTDRYMYRYWDGSQWSDQVSGGGTGTTDELSLESPGRDTPPAPGTAALDPFQQPPQPMVVVTQNSGSGFAGVIGVALVIIAIIVIIVALTNRSSDDSTSNPATPVTTQAPASTTAP
jgi:Protein of unknown function (DUF2510)